MQSGEWAGQSDTPVKDGAGMRTQLSRIPDEWPTQSLVTIGFHASPYPQYYLDEVLQKTIAWNARSFQRICNNLYPLAAAQPAVFKKLCFSSSWIRCQKCCICTSSASSNSLQQCSSLNLENYSKAPSLQTVEDVEGRSGCFMSTCCMHCYIHFFTCFDFVSILKNWEFLVLKLQTHFSLPLFCH